MANAPMTRTPRTPDTAFMRPPDLAVSVRQSIRDASAAQARACGGFGPGSELTSRLSAYDGASMSDLLTLPTTDATDLYRTRDELYATDMVIAAVDGLDLFTALHQEPRSVEALARHYGF